MRPVEPCIATSPCCPRSSPAAVGGRLVRPPWQLMNSPMSSARCALIPVAQHLDGAALGDLALQPGQKPPPNRTVFGQRQRLAGLRLGATHEGRELQPYRHRTRGRCRESCGRSTPLHSTASGRRCRWCPCTYATALRPVLVQPSPSTWSGRSPLSACRDCLRRRLCLDQPVLIPSL